MKIFMKLPLKRSLIYLTPSQTLSFWKFNLIVKQSRKKISNYHFKLLLCRCPLAKQVESFYYPEKRKWFSFMILYEKSETQIWIIYNWNVFSNWRMNIYLSVFHINNFVIKQKPLEHFSGCGTRLWSLAWSNGSRRCYYFHQNGLMKDDLFHRAASVNWPHFDWRP